MEYLPDPLDDRPCKDVLPFVNRALSDAVLFPINADGESIVDWKLLE